MGRRWGKTYMAGVYALTVADLGGAVAWVVPTYKNARAPWRFVEATVAPAARRLRINRAERVIEFPSGGRLSVYSADNDASLLGEAFDAVIMDEAARVREETYTDVLLPTLADRDGRIVLISTPRGRNWFWREWTRGQGDGVTVASWTAPTAANPLPSIKAAAEMARHRVSERTYRQEWLAEFLEDGGEVFRRVSDAATATPLAQGEPGGQYVMGLDWGKLNDWTVITVLDAETRRMVYLDRFNQIDYAVQLARVQAVCQRFEPYVIIAERNSIGEPLIEQMQRRDLPVVPFQTTAQSKMHAIDALALAFEQGEITILPDATLMAELSAYEMQRMPSGLTRYGAPSGLHDDCVMSLALAWQGMNQNQPLFLFGNPE